MTVFLNPFAPSAIGYAVSILYAAIERNFYPNVPEVRNLGIEASCFMGAGFRFFGGP